MDMAQFLLARVAEDKEIARMAERFAAEVGLNDNRWQWWTTSGMRIAGMERGPRGSVECSPKHALEDCDVRGRIITRCQEEMLSGIPRLVHFAKQTLWEMSAPYGKHPDFAEAAASIVISDRPLTEADIAYGQRVAARLRADEAAGGFVVGAHTDLWDLNVDGDSKGQAG